MNLFIISLLLFIGFGWTEQSGEPEEASLNQEFNLKIGREALIKDEGVKVAFISVIEDSRCPAGANCIWEGNGKIRLKLSKSNNDSATIELNTNVEPQLNSYLDYQLKLIRLTPYPKANENTKSENYMVTLLVCKK